MKTRTLLSGIAGVILLCMSVPLISTAHVASFDTSGFEMVKPDARARPGTMSLFQDGNLQSCYGLDINCISGSCSFHADTLIRYSMNSGNEKFIYSYDNSGRLISKLVRMWVINDWQNTEIFLYTYDILGNQLTSEHKKWLINDWANDSRAANIYNGGNCITTIDELWDGSAWNFNGKSIFTYDCNAQILSEIYQLWDGAAWENFTLDSLSYDIYGNKTECIDLMWNGAEWIYNSRENYTYNNDKILSYVYQFWNGIEWTNNYQCLYTYDESGFNTHYVEQSWSLSIEEWVNNFQIMSIYDPNGHRLSYTSQYCINGSNWENNTKGNFIYDSGNNLLTASYLKWESYDNTGWVNTSRLVYDNQALYVKVDASMWSNNTWIPGDCFFGVEINRYGEACTFETMNGPALQFWAYFSYDGVGMGDESNKSIFHIYPNPSHGNVNIECNENTMANMKVLNALGQIVAEQQVSGKSIVHINETGIYIIRINNGRSYFTEKIIVQ
jgi:hypothetical protein